jgi:hypothetical protein
MSALSPIGGELRACSMNDTIQPAAAKTACHQARPDPPLGCNRWFVAGSTQSANGAIGTTVDHCTVFAEPRQSDERGYGEKRKAEGTGENSEPSSTSMQPLEITWKPYRGSDQCTEEDNDGSHHCWYPNHSSQ